MKTPISLTSIILLLAVTNLWPTTHYVDVNSTNATPPFLDWHTAATNIQDSVDVAEAGDEVVVTNGIYASGGRAVGTNLIVNRVAVDRAITLRSVNGPQVTIIQGYQLPSTTNGDGAIRCVYLTNGASLFGFALTNGATRYLGDYAKYVKEQSGGGVFCESPAATVSNCIVQGNSAFQGGGVYSGTLFDCTVSTNSARDGGGTYFSRLNNCTLSGNQAGRSGGGAWNSDIWVSGTNYGTLNNCALIGNIAGSGGGGANNGKLNDCMLIGNVAGGGAGVHGGALSCALTNCLLLGNSTFGNGGGVASACTLFNCTLTGNSAANGGGAYLGALYQCVLAGNWATNRGGGLYGTADSGVMQSCLLTSNCASNGGGGLYRGTKSRYCILGGNWTPSDGGGALSGSLESCLLTNNRAGNGGGANGTALASCTVVGNWATNSGGGLVNGRAFKTIIYYNTSFGTAPDYSGDYSYFDNSCAPVTGGYQTVTNQPMFVDVAGGNLRLQSNSPCINAGNNSWTSPSSIDLDGNPRVVGGMADIGAYECQSPALLDYYAWLQGYGLSTHALDIYKDSDADGLNNWQEWRCQTCPTNTLSALRLLSALPAGTDVTVTWQSAAGVSYFLEQSTNLASPFTLLAADILGQAGTTSYTDTNAAALTTLFYRLAVQ